VNFFAQMKRNWRAAAAINDLAANLLIDVLSDVFPFVVSSNKH
jgi:hypothetical protein